MHFVIISLAKLSLLHQLVGKFRNVFYQKSAAGYFAISHHSLIFRNEKKNLLSFLASVEGRFTEELREKEKETLCASENLFIS